LKKSCLRRGESGPGQGPIGPQGVRELGKKRRKRLISKGKKKRPSRRARFPQGKGAAGNRKKIEKAAGKPYA